MPVQPTSAEIGESAVEGQTTTAGGAELAGTEHASTEQASTEQASTEQASSEQAASATSADSGSPTEQEETPLADTTAATDPADAKSAPADTKAAPADTKAAPADAKAGPANAKSVPADTKAAPADRKSAPADAAPAAAAAVTAPTPETPGGAPETPCRAPGTPGPASETPGGKPAASTPWRAPGLDGVRALAVLAVLAFHESLPWIPGGFLGVDVFFVLSGYLITDLLAARFGRDGNIGLASFYQRRARRLLPALALMLLTVTAAVSVLEPGQRTGLRPALLGAVTYTSNWWQAFAHHVLLLALRAAARVRASVVTSGRGAVLPDLAAAPVLILVIARRPAARAAFAWAGALASALAMLFIYTPGSDPSLVYYGTDTHASALMIGAALALTWPLAKVAATGGRVRLSLDIAGAAGLVILAWAAWHLSGANPVVYPYGLVLAALASGALILAAAAPGRIGAMLSAKPLRWLGIRSYGIYLWHWPVIAITAGIAPRSATSAPARLIDAVLPIGLAAASWRWLEEPILRNGLRAELARRVRLLLLAPAAALRTPSAPGRW